MSIGNADDVRQWWVRPEGYEEDEDELAFEKARAVIKQIQHEQDRKRELLLFGAMYAGGAPPAGGGMAVDAYVRTTPRGKSNLSLNLSRNVVDAVVSRVFSKSKPVLKYATEGGGPEHQEMAKQLTRGIAGVFYQTDAYDKFVDLGRDGGVFGTGCQRIYPCFDSNRVEIDRWMPWERILDDSEVFYGRPRTWYSRRYEDRYVVVDRVRKGLWATGDEEELARKARLVEMLKGEVDEDAEFGYQQHGCRVLVSEAWRAPSGKDATDGRYVKCVSNCTLIDEQFDGEYGGIGDEFIDYRWSKPIVGFYGQGIVELGSGIQAEVNKMLRQFQSIVHMITGKWLVANGSGVLTAHINNAIDTIIKHNPGMPPQYVTPPLVDPQFLQHLWALCDRYYRIVGINEQMAAAMKPEGLKSGEAQREYAEQQSETLLEKGQRFEKAVQDAGELVARSAKELAGHGVYEVRALSDDGFDVVNWGELDDPDGMELVCAPTSSLPGTISGKVDLAYDLLQIGDYDPGDVEDIIGMPDVFQRTQLKRASARLVAKRVGAMLTQGEVWSAPSYINLAEAKVIAQQMLCLAEERDTDDERLQLVRDFLVSVDDRIQEGTPPPATPAPPGQPGEAPPGAPPEAPPGPQAPPGAMPAAA